MNRMVQNGDNIVLDIVRVLLRRENHLRAIAKELGYSLSTIMRKLKVLEDSNVVSYRMEGRNKIFHLKDNIYVLKNKTLPA